MATVMLVWAGPLSPPGGPITSTNKTLQEVEPRIAVGPTTTPGTATTVFRITQPGSYYLTGNVFGPAGKSGVEIVANDVTLDLNGFEVLGAAGSLTGVLSTKTNVRVRNGVVTGWGRDGVQVSGSGSRVADIVARSNGQDGVQIGSFSQIVRCTAQGNGSAGIRASSQATVDACVASNNGSRGISAGGEVVVTKCVAVSNGSDGILTGSNAVIARCVSRFNKGKGIDVNGRGHVEACIAELNDDHGIEVTFDSIVLNNTCHNNGRGVTITDGAGVNIDGGDNRIEGNHVTSNDRGIATRIASNVIIRNTARSNLGGNFVVQAGDTFGPFLVVTAGSITSTNPWANISF